MTTTTLAGTVATQANVYFDGKCVSHTVTLADGVRKSVGVILPATLTFNTGAPEIMETVAGKATIKLSSAEVARVEGVLKQAGIQPDFVEFEGTSIKARFKDTDTQMKARDAIKQAEENT